MQHIVKGLMLWYRICMIFTQRSIWKSKECWKQIQDKFYSNLINHHHNAQDINWLMILTTTSDLFDVA